MMNVDEPLFYDLDWATEDGLASAFTRQYGGALRYCTANKNWLIWTGHHWELDQVLHVSHLTRLICRLAAEQASTPELKQRLSSWQTIASVEKLARTDPEHAIAQGACWACDRHDSCWGRSYSAEQPSLGC